MSGSEWTRHTLALYNIEIKYVDTKTFFGGDLPALPAIDQEVLVHQEADEMTATRNCKLINLLDLANLPRKNRESHVDDFALSLFESLGYVTRTRVAVTQADLPLWVCGERRNAQTDVCIMDTKQNNNILLLVQEDKGIGAAENIGAEGQLVAEAIGAFHYNNHRRLNANLPVLDKTVMPGIIMVGTSPYFYRIPITSGLCSSVSIGSYPTDPSVVLAHIPELPRPNLRLSEGMKPLDNRRHILRCYEAFKKYVN